MKSLEQPKHCQRRAARKPIIANRELRSRVAVTRHATAPATRGPLVAIPRRCDTCAIHR
eukprot:COSAG02_NODE_43561_length_373_cov_1.317518_1_plen_58_part_10